MSEFYDDQLGLVVVRHHHQSRGVRFRVSPKGILTASVPPRTRLTTVRRAVASARLELQTMLDEHRRRVIYRHDQLIGKSHRLTVVASTDVESPQVSRRDRLIVATVPSLDIVDEPLAQQAIQTEVIKALRREAKVYLERRLRRLADRHGYSYQRLRFTHTGTRWGSCSSTGTISLNIALMMLPLDLIDYVLIHELCHTLQMNHSTEFWQLVESADPRYKVHRRSLKTYSPAL